jgi:signal transduction histidine kinase
VWLEIINKAEEVCNPLNRTLVFIENLKSNEPFKILRINLQQLLIAFGLILDNAIKYSHKNTEITISIEITGDYCALIVANDGVGFSENAFKQTAFERGENVAHTSGLGLGLIITKEIIEKMDGNLQISNFFAADDKTKVLGSQVTLNIPFISA